MKEIGSEKKLRKLEKKVEELESKVEQLEKGTNDSKAFQIMTWTVVILEFATVVYALISTILD